MAGLRRICKAMGGMTITANGKTVHYVWDYVADEPVRCEEMPVGSERHKASERAKYLQNPPRNALQCAARACPGCTVCTPARAPAHSEGRP